MTVRSGNLTPASGGNEHAGAPEQRELRAEDSGKVQ